MQYAKKNSGNLKLSFILSFTLSFLAAQRILLESIYAYICVFFAIGALVYWLKSDYSMRNVFIVMAIFTSVDIGLTYSATPSIIRYVIYLLALLPFFFLKSYNRKRTIIFFAGVIFLTLNTYFSISQGAPLSVSHFVNELFFLVLFFVVFCVGESELENFALDARFLFLCLLGFLIGECLNSLYFDFSTFGYMSYDTTKALIVMPFFYAFCNLNFLKKGIIFVATSFVLVMYVTRMIILSSVVILTILIIRRLDLKLITFATLIILSVSALAPASLDFGAYKATGSLVEALSADNLVFALKSLDPVRAVEQEMLFSRNAFHLLFGEGIGIGYQDSRGLFSFIDNGLAAFSDEELSNKKFFNFHDFWTDIGFRFGLIFSSLILFYLIVKVTSANIEQRIFGGVIFVLLFCSFFSTPGLLMIALLSLALRYEANKSC